MRIPILLSLVFSLSLLGQSQEQTGIVAPKPVVDVCLDGEALKYRIATKDFGCVAWPVGGSGITTLNTLTTDPQLFAVGTTGTDFNISSVTATHTFNIPDASATNRGLITNGTQTIAGTKTFSSTITGSISGLAGTASALAADPGDCTNQFARGIVAAGTATCASVAGTDFATQTANFIFSGPVSGGAASPTFRALVAADVPTSLTSTTSVNSTTIPASKTLMATDTAIADAQMATKYKIMSMQPGLGDGLNAIASGTYVYWGWYNDTGVTVTITGIKCHSDNGGTTTLDVKNGAGTSLLTGVITCTVAGASGTQSGTTTIASADHIGITIVADGTSKEVLPIVSASK